MEIFCAMRYTIRIECRRKGDIHDKGYFNQ